MKLESLSLVNFRNYEDADLQFSSGVNCLVGENGAGKTTVLDAIYYLSFCKSYFNAIDSQNIRYGEAYFLLQGRIERNGENDKLSCGVKSGQKKQFRRNDKEYTRLADHIGMYPAVIMTPNDIDLIKEGSEVRRKFIDSIISQYNRTYLDRLIDYNRVLLQRNNLLRYFSENRTWDEESIDIWDQQMIEIGSYLHQERKLFVDAFIPTFNSFYQRISGNAEDVSLAYQSELSEGGYGEKLKRHHERDRQLRRSNCGIHKDDLDFLIDGHPIRRFGSQGQQKTYLIALKLAQFAFIEKATGVKPLLLLDDIFDKIDDKRVSALLQLVSERTFGQIFISDTHEDRVPKMFEEITTDVRIFRISKEAIDVIGETV
ncbi:MAG: DNA replication and repair protein RecF [Flavobacteriaceae bacterium]|nr:DNA replication and repair protein RecF [Flavobacteriaceae bacterium]